MNGAVRLALTTFALASCAGNASTVLPPPSDYLRAGVEPSLELDRIAAQYTEQGFTTHQRLVVADGAIALGAFRHSDGREALRVVTRRGMAVALNAETESRLLQFRAASLAEIDGIALAAHDVDLARTCWALFVLQPDAEGLRLREEVLRLTPEGDECVGAFEQLGGDPTPEAMVVARLVVEGLEVAPVVVVPLARTSVGWIVADGPPYADYWRNEVSGREHAVGEARSDQDRVRLAVELSLIRRHRGAGPDEVRSRFLSLTEGVSPALRAAALDSLASL